MSAAPLRPDADLIAACARHVENVRAYNDPHADGLVDETTDPLWIAYHETRDLIANATPQTIAGMVAKARAAKGEAKSQSAEGNPRGSVAEVWAWHLVHDLLRLFDDRPAPADQDAELIAICKEICRLERVQRRISRLYAHDDKAGDALIEPYHNAEKKLVHRCCQIQATTLPGIQARMRALKAEGAVCFHFTDINDPEDYWDQRMLLATCRDLLAVGGGRPDASPHPQGETGGPRHEQARVMNAEADMLAACEVFEAAHAVYWKTDPERDEAEWRAVTDAKDEAAEALAAVKPRTLADHAARAASTLLCGACFAPDNLYESLANLPQGLLEAVLRDLAAANAPGYDAALIADCATFDVLERKVHAIHGDEPEQDAGREQLAELQRPIVTRIVQARATTFEGHAARARSLILWDPSVVGPGSGDSGQCILHGLLRDLVGQAFVDAMVRDMLPATGEAA